MNDRQRRRQERVAQVRDFTTTVKISFPAGSKGAASIERINQLVERVAALAASYETNRRVVRTGTDGKSEAREALRALLSAIGRTARAIGMDNPDVRGKFRLPDNNPNNQTLVSTARSFLAEATPLKAQFIEYGMSADFLDVLDAKIKEFESHAEQQHTGQSSRVADRAAIDAALDEADAEIARFDAIVRNKFANDPATLAAWETARHTERVPQKRKSGDAKDTAPPAEPPK